MAPKIGRSIETGNDQPSLAEKMGNREIENLRPNSKSENIDIFLKNVFKTDNRESFETFKNDYINDLDYNTAHSQKETYESGNYAEYSQEELEEIWDNDPQYVNEKVYRPLPGTSQESIERQNYNPEEIIDNDSLYMTDGLHGDYDKKGLINWQADSVEGTEVEIKIPEGTLLKRYGQEGGHYFTDIDTNFEELNLPSDRFKATNYMVIKPLSAVKSTIEDQPFTLRQKDSPKATQYKTEMNVVELIENGYLKKIDDGDNVKIGHFNEGAETKRNDVKEGCTDRGEKHIDDKPSIIDTLKNKFQKKEAIEGNDQAQEQKIGFGDKLKSLFSKERANDGEEKNVENEKPYKNDREKFMDSFKVDKNGEYVESREKKNDSNTDANPEDNDQMNESRNESSKTNDFRESLKVEVDPYAHLNVKDAPQREPGGRVRGPESNHHLDDDVER